MAQKTIIVDVPKEDSLITLAMQIVDKLSNLEITLIIVVFILASGGFGMFKWLKRR